LIWLAFTLPWVLAGLVGIIWGVYSLSIGSTDDALIYGAIAVCSLLYVGMITAVIASDRK
jgi:hypothetical protein